MLAPAYIVLVKMEEEKMQADLKQLLKNFICSMSIILW